MIMSILRRLRKRSAVATLGPRRIAASGGELVEASSFASRLQTLLHGTEGSTLFETAITSIFMCTVLLGIFSVSMALVAYQQLGYATMSATQILAAGRSILTDPCKTAANQITASLPAWNSNNFSYTVTITSTVNGATTTTSYGPFIGSGATCTAAATTLTNATGGLNGNPVTLHVTYTYNWFPILKSITGTLATEFTMLVE
jgi:Flp pilus assembly protein TadG